MKKIYIVDDQKDITDLLVRYLRKENYEVEGYYDGRTALEAIKYLPPDLLILDIYMPKTDGMQIMKIVKDSLASIKVLIITAYPENEKLDTLLKDGAVDVIAKPFKLNDILLTIKRIFTLGKESYEDRVCKNSTFIAESPRILECVDTAVKVSNTSSPVLILGETGTGKELMVDRIHCKGMRRHNKLVKINCAFMPKDLIEGELLGYEKGAFTGAATSKAGKVEEANGGTLFLDEICELDKSLQSKLLRLLEYKRFERLGSNEAIYSDFRLICATNEDIVGAVKAGRFREDLYYRISTIIIKIPPLRERREDIEPLVRYFMASFKEHYVTPVNDISREAIEVLKRYPWPGNVRELKNVIDMILGISSSERIELMNLPDYLFTFEGDASLYASKGELHNLEDMEKEYISMVLRKVNYNKKKASAILGISERTLYNKINKYHLL